MWFSRSLLHRLVKCEVCVVVLSWVCIVGGVADHTPTYIMSDHCRSLLDLKDLNLPSLRLQLTQRSAYRPHTKCALTLRAPPQQRLVMVVEWMDIATGGFQGACTDFLSVWEGEVGNRTKYVEGLDDKICGNEAPPSVASQGQSVTLYFDSNTVENGAGFSILLTAFHHGKQCKEGEFHCDNDRCISQRLKCDDDDNCGDGSDTCLLSITTAALVVIVITVVCCIVAGAVVLYRHRDSLPGRKKCPDPNEVNQPTATESTTASTIPDTTSV